MIIIIFLVFYSCKEIKATKIDSPIKATNNHNLSSDSKAASKLNSINTKNSTAKCNDLLIEIIKTSNIINPFKDNFTIELDEITESNIKISMYDEGNVVGNLLLDAQNLKLLDLTNDPDNGEIISFNLNNWNSIIDCYFAKNKKLYAVEIKKSNCITKEIEMGSEESCIFVHSTLEAVYNDLITKQPIANSTSLLRKLPSKSAVVNTNANGLVSITYEVNKNLIKIEMLFSGGITTISLEKIGYNVKRIILSSAD